MSDDTGEPQPDSQIIDEPDFPPTAHLEIIYREVKASLDVQRTELDDLQRIVAIVLTAAGVVLGFAASQFPAFGSGHKQFWIFVAALSALAVDLAVGVAALWPRDVKTIAPPGPIVDQYATAATNEMLYDMIAAVRAAFDKNETNGVRLWRSRFVRSQLALLAVGSVLLGVGILLLHV